MIEFIPNKKNWINNNTFETHIVFLTDAITESGPHKNKPIHIDVTDKPQHHAN